MQPGIAANSISIYYKRVQIISAIIFRHFLIRNSTEMQKFFNINSNHYIQIVNHKLLSQCVEFQTR